MNKVADLFKGSVIWVLGILFTVFTCLLSIEGNFSSSVDGLTAKTTKAAVTNFIPVFGKIMGDSVDSVLGCVNILKNAIGLFGNIIIISIVLIPVIKTIIGYFLLKSVGAVLDGISDSKIVNVIEKSADIYKVMLGILFSVSIMFIVGITIVLNITNASMMYR